MHRRPIEVDGQTYFVAPLESPAAGNRHCALLSVGLTDETTGRAPRAPVAVALTYPVTTGAVARLIDPGTVVVSGKPEAVLAPRLATTGRLDLRLTAPGFIPRALSVRFACRVRALAAPGGGTLLTLDSTAGLAVEQRLLISTPDGVRAEFRTIGALGPGLNQVTLAAPLSSPYPPGSPVQPLPAVITVDLHRTATVVGGRIMKRIGMVVAPLANANVRISKIWREIPGAGVAVGPEPPLPAGPVPMPPWDPPLATIWPPCYADLAVGAAVEFEDRPIDGVMSAKTLLDTVAAGATEMRLSDAVSLTVGDVIAIDADDDGRREMIEVTRVSLAATPSDWASVTLSQPLALTHRRGCLIRRLAPVAPALVRALNYPAAQGDQALLFDARAVTGRHQIRVVGSGPLRSYHRLTVLATTSDATGFYRLPPLARAGKVEVSAKDSGSAAQHAVELVPDYGLAENPLDITVS
jgi:hypothetical protein